MALEQKLPPIAYPIGIENARVNGRFVFGVFEHSPLEVARLAFPVCLHCYIDGSGAGTFLHGFFGHANLLEPSAFAQAGVVVFFVGEVGCGGYRGAELLGSCAGGD